jgi:hypothetical protein
VPIVVAAAHALVVGWMPTGDRAYFVVRAFDVFSDRSPLVGPWSSGATAAVGQVVYSPGPMLYWLIAIPARFFDESLVQVTAGLVNVACITGTLILAHRRGGMPLALATAIAVPVMTGSLPQQTHADIWNSSAPLFPLLLLIFLCWSLACGEYRLLPVTALVASFIVQSHLTFVAPVAGVVLVGLVGLAVTRPVRRSKRALRWMVAAAALTLACWLPPLIDQATNDPGNLSLLVDAATSSEPTLGHTAGWHALVHTVGVVPWWLSDPRSGIERIGDIAASPGAVAAASSLLVLAMLAISGVLGLRRRRLDVCAAAALGLVLSLAVAFDAATTPRSALVTLDYTLRWASPAGMCVWLLLGWSVLTLIGPIRTPVSGRGPALAGLAVAVAVAVVVTISVDPLVEPYDQMRAIRDRLAERIPDRGATRVDGTSFDALAFKAGAVYELRRAGKGVVATGAGQVLGDDYDPSAGYTRRLRIDVAAPGSLPAADRSGHALVREAYSTTGRQPPNRELRVSVLPAR